MFITYVWLGGFEERWKKLVENRKENEWEGCLIGRERGRKKIVGLSCSFFELTKTQPPKNGEKIGVKMWSKTWIKMPPYQSFGCSGFAFFFFFLRHLLCFLRYKCNLFLFILFYFFIFYKQFCILEFLFLKEVVVLFFLIKI